jgi:hypothetical protein
MTLDEATSLVSESRDLTPEDWTEDCGGSWDNCSVLPLLYDYDEGDVDPNARDVADTYNPFEDEDEDEPEARPLTSFTPPAIAEKQAEERAESEQESYSAGSLEYASDATFSMHQVPDPYKVKCDAMLVPVNNLLEPMDLMLMRHAGAYFDAASTSYQGPIVTGEVYPVKSPYPSVSARSLVYRGVVVSFAFMVSSMLWYSFTKFLSSSSLAICNSKSARSSGGISLLRYLSAFSSLFSSISFTILKRQSRALP